MEIPAWLGVVMTTLGIAAIMGGVVATFRASYSKARIEALREDNQDLRNRIEDLEAKEVRSSAKEDELESDIVHLKNENETLRELVLQRVEIVGLGDLMTMHHQQAMQHWDKMTEAIETLVRHHEER